MNSKTPEKTEQLLRVLADSTANMARALNAKSALENLAELVVAELCDWTLIVTTNRAGNIEHICARHRAGHEEELALIAKSIAADTKPNATLARILHTGAAQLVNNYSSTEQRKRREQMVEDRSILDQADQLGADSVIFAPLMGRDHIDGILMFVRGQQSPQFTQEDLAVSADLGRRAGLILDNTRLYESEHHIAATLQRSLLPVLPEIENVKACARYRASESGASVGGDFYELITLRSNAIGIAIGDVVGHDVLAAAAMGHLRGLLRACAWDDISDPASADPANVLSRVDELMLGLELTAMASVAYARAELRDNQWHIQFSNAGHPPLVIKKPNGEVALLDCHHDMMLGVQNVTRTSMDLTVERGTLIIAFTDGLVESRNQPLAVGLTQLVELIAQQSNEPEEICDQLLAGFKSLTDDDVALLSVRLD